MDVKVLDIVNADIRGFMPTIFRAMELIPNNTNNLDRGRDLPFALCFILSKL